jgi:hypothetical protein
MTDQNDPDADASWLGDGFEVTEPAPPVGSFTVGVPGEGFIMATPDGEVTGHGIGYHEMSLWRDERPRITFSVPSGDGDMYSRMRALIDEAVNAPRTLSLPKWEPSGAPNPPKALEAAGDNAEYHDDPPEPELIW